MIGTITYFTVASILRNTTLWPVLLSSVCLVGIWQRWRQAHPRCSYCRKRVRRAFAHCPWCGIQQFHTQRVRPMRQHRKPQRASRDVFVAQEAAMMPYKRPRTVVLPDISAQQSSQQQQTDWRRETILVPESKVRSRVRMCPHCFVAQRPGSKRCKHCGSTILFWMER